MRYEIIGGTFDLVTEFKQPVFGLLDQPAGLTDAVWQQLGSGNVGLHLRDMRLDVGFSLNDRRLQCSAWNLGLEVRIYLSRVEVRCSDVLRADFQTFNNAVSPVLDAVVRANPACAFKSHAFTLGVHGRVQDVGAREYVRRFVAPPPTTGQTPEPVGAGVVFYYGATDSQLWASLSVDHSSLEDGAVYTKLHTVWDGDRVHVGDLARAASSSSMAAFELLRLEPGGLNFEGA